MGNSSDKEDEKPSSSREAPLFYDPHKAVLPSQPPYPRSPAPGSSLPPSSQTGSYGRSDGGRGVVEYPSSVYPSQAQRTSTPITAQHPYVGGFSQARPSVAPIGYPQQTASYSARIESETSYQRPVSAAPPQTKPVSQSQGYSTATPPAYSYQSGSYYQSQGTARVASGSIPPVVQLKPVTTQSSSVPYTQSSSVPYTQSSSVPYTQSSSVPYTQRSSVPYTQSSSVPYTQRSSVPYTQSSSVPYTQSSSVPYTQRSSVPYTHSSSVPYTHSSSVPYTHSSSVPYTQSSSVPYTQSRPAVASPAPVSYSSQQSRPAAQSISPLQPSSGPTTSTYATLPAPIKPSTSQQSANPVSTSRPAALVPRPVSMPVVYPQPSVSTPVVKPIVSLQPPTSVFKPVVSLQSSVKPDTSGVPQNPVIPTAPPKSGIRFFSLDEYKEYFSKLLDLERQQYSTTFCPKLQGSKLKCTGNRGKRYCYKLKLPSIEGFNFGDQFLLKYENAECAEDHSQEVVHIHELDEDAKTIEFLGKYGDGTEIQYYQCLPHRRMVNKLEALTEEHPLLDILLGDPAAPNESDRYFSYTPEAGSRIDDCQAQAISTALNSKVTLILGPPGSGKTSVAAELISKLALTDQKILVCAPSNVATDNLAIRLKEKHMSVLRFYSKGSEKKTNIADKFAFHSYVHSLACVYFPNHTNRLLQLKNCSRNAVKAIIGDDEIVAIEKEVMETHQIICATCSSSADAILANFTFDTVIIDEAAFCTEPEALIPIASGCQRVILVGDPKQLRPLIMSEEAKSAGLEISLFERLMNTNLDAKMLAKQYRMHPTISYYPRTNFYEGKLEDGIDDSKRDLSKYTVSVIFAKSPVVFVHCDGKEEYFENTSSRWNKQEANLMITIIQKMKKLDVHLNSIGVVTPYEGQRLTLCKLVEEKLGLTPSDLEIKNIDGYQGREKDFILMSCVRSNCNNIGFLSNKNRINVALTRAKYGLIIVGNAATLSMEADWGGFVAYVHEKGHFMFENDFEKIGEGTPGKDKFGFT